MLPETAFRQELESRLASSVAVGDAEIAIATAKYKERIAQILPASILDALGPSKN